MWEGVAEPGSTGKAGADGIAEPTRGADGKDAAIWTDGFATERLAEKLLQKGVKSGRDWKTPLVEHNSEHANSGCFKVCNHPSGGFLAGGVCFQYQNNSVNGGPKQKWIARFRQRGSIDQHVLELFA